MCNICFIFDEKKEINISYALLDVQISLSTLYLTTGQVSCVELSKIFSFKINSTKGLQILKLDACLFSDIFVTNVTQNIDCDPIS